MSWKHCCECSKEMERCLPTVQHVDKTVSWVCRKCWDTFLYDLYMDKEKAKEAKQNVR